MPSLSHPSGSSPGAKALKDFHSASRGQMSTVRNEAYALRGSERGEGRWPVWAPVPWTGVASHDEGKE